MLYRIIKKSFLFKNNIILLYLEWACLNSLFYLYWPFFSKKTKGLSKMTVPPIELIELIIQSFSIPVQGMLREKTSL
jgi:hypothetical protein